jgi:hypothetical protein
MLWLLLGLFRRSLCSRRDLLLENLALRQQLLVLKRRHTRSRLNRIDRLFWVVTRRPWSRWKGALVIITPETVVSLAPCRLPVRSHNGSEGTVARCKLKSRALTSPKFGQSGKSRRTEFLIGLSKCKQLEALCFGSSFPPKFDPISRLELLEEVH